MDQNDIDLILKENGNQAFLNGFQKIDKINQLKKRKRLYRENTALI